MSWTKEQKEFEAAIDAFRAEIYSVGVHLGIDAHGRDLYAREIAKMAAEFRAQAGAGRITWAEAARQAQETRNICMEEIRRGTTPFARAYAESEKKVGRTFSYLLQEKTKVLYGQAAEFERLLPDQQNRVFVAIVDSSGRSKRILTDRIKKLSRVSRGLVFLSVAVSAYYILQAEDKPKAIAHEAGIFGSGVLGGIGGGAAAGLVCGPGAPVCVGIGAFIGGALAAFGFSYFSQ